MFKIQTLNTISSLGLNQFPKNLYEISSDVLNPDAILVRSYNMLDMKVPSTVKLVGRAGAGTNNIPVSSLTEKGIPVFNTPGANANAVRELVLAGMLLASRHICTAWEYVKSLNTDHASLEKEIESHKKQFVGTELFGKKLGIIGLGSVGVKVANAAIHLGMQVIGYDPAITVNRAWELSANVKQSHKIDELLSTADFISVHVPLTNETQNMIDASKLQLVKKGVIILNFARDGIINLTALLTALNEKKVHCYVTDFPSLAFQNHPQVISLPHLGASTKEAEENCAVMLARQVRDFLEFGAIVNSVNFPSLDIPQSFHTTRLAIVNANIPNMVAQISSKLASAGINIVSLHNQSKDLVAYTVIDVSQELDENLLKQIQSISGVKQVRILKPLTQ